MPGRGVQTNSSHGAQHAMIETKLDCPECGAIMMLREVVFDGRKCRFYGCVNWPLCDGSYGAHPDGSPLGIPANAATKTARIRAHDAFDRLWKSGRMTRNQAYVWLRRRMNLTFAEGHIGRFDAEQCERLIVLANTELTKRPS